MTGESPLPVLISSAGRRAALVGAFRGARPEVELHACDLVPGLSSACALADAAHAVPRCTEPSFIDAIEDIVRRHGIRLIVPTIDTELPAYAAAAGRLAAAGARVHVSSPEVVAIARDKLRTMTVLAQAGAPVPDTVDEATLRADPGRLGWPVFGKPVGGSASRGLGVYADAAALPPAFAEPMMFQPVLSGREFTVNLFIDQQGRLRCVVPHERLQVRAGEVEKGRTTRREDLARLAGLVHRALPGAQGVLCFQVIDDPVLGPRIIEINARFGGGYPLAHAAGARFADWLVDEVAAGSCAAHDDWRDGVVMLRYDDAVFLG